MAAAKLPPIAKNTLTSPRIIASSAGDDVMSRLGRRLEAEAAFQAVEEFRLGNFRDADGSIALHVGMAANRTYAGAFAADIAAQ